MRKSCIRAVVAACLVVVVATAAGCDGVSRNDPASVAGNWNWQIIPYGCSALGGIHAESQNFDLSQSGEQVSGSFVDSAGNAVTIDATYEPSLLEGWIEVNTPGGRRVMGHFRADVTFDAVGDRQLSGLIRILSDTEQHCRAASTEIYATTGPGTGPITDPGQVFEQCGAVDIVFVMDTSGSMNDEAAALCTRLDGVLDNIASFGLEDLRVFKWGITEDADDDSDFPCLTDNVRDVFGDPIVPGTQSQRLVDSEDWGTAATVVAELGSNGSSQAFQWRPDAIRILVPISDEGPFEGDPADTPEADAAIAAAIAAGQARGIIMSPIIGTGAEPATSEHARDLAEGTGGIAVRSTDPDLDFGQLIFDIVFTACGGQLQPPEPPAAVGPTILVAAAREGGIYRIDPETGSISFLVQTPIEQLGEPELTHISSMIFNERTGAVWAGTGGQSVVPAGIYVVDPTGVVSLLQDNSGEMDALPGMTQRRIDRFVFAMNGDDDDLYAISNTTGFAAQYADDIPDIYGGGGNALTFVGEDLFLASDVEFWSLDPFSGSPTLIGEIVLSGFNFPAPPDFNVLSMTTRPSDNAVFAIVRVRGIPQVTGGETRNTFLGRVNVATGAIALIGNPHELQLDGIAWVPSDYFTPIE